MNLIEYTIVFSKKDKRSKGDKIDHMIRGALVGAGATTMAAPLVSSVTHVVGKHRGVPYQTRNFRATKNAWDTIEYGIAPSMLIGGYMGYKYGHKWLK